MVAERASHVNTAAFAGDIQPFQGTDLFDETREQARYFSVGIKSPRWSVRSLSIRFFE